MPDIGGAFGKLPMWGKIFFTVVVPAIAGTALMVTAVPPAWSALGWGVPATRGYVDGRVDPMRVQLSQLGVAQDRQTLVLLQSQLYTAEQDMSKSPSASIAARIADLQQQIAEVQARISAATVSRN